VSIFSVAPISYEKSITKKETPLNIFQGNFLIFIKRELTIRIYSLKPLTKKYRGGGKIIVKIL
jgi:hypothetical protein